jgi:ferrous iron transport protein B
MTQKIKYEDPVELSIEIALEQIEAILGSDYAFSKRAIGLLLLQRDPNIEHMVQEAEPANFDRIKDIVRDTEKHYSHPLDFVITSRRQLEVNDILKHVTRPVDKKRTSFRERLSQITMNPLTGTPILLLVLYWGLYKFVGEFGAGTVVDFLEGTVFEDHVNPLITRLFEAAVPWALIQSLFVGEYGLITLGIRYAVAIILPIVTIFFIAFSVIEDTGYLPRLAMLIDRVFKKIGLSGRAVIPMVLGFGCDTMATMVTRTLPTKRERFIATMLLALAVPCSAQIGVIMAILEGRRLALFVWAAVITMVFLFVGHLTAKILPGERPTFYMEVPPLRLPKIKNVLVKTYSRVRWYFKEILPLFILASMLIWVGQITGLFALAINVLEGPVKLIGLPPEAARIFLFGFFRRDYGAAGLYDLNKTGALTGVQLVVACVALTLFLPCVAQLLMNIKERGIKAGLGISLFVLIFSFSVAFVVNLLLNASGIVL